MKTILLADERSELLATLEPILKHWGYRVLSTTRIEQIGTFLAESDPALLIVGFRLHDRLGTVLDKKATRRLETGDLPLIVLKQHDASPPDLPAGEFLDVPLELFELFSFIQRQVEHHPRQNLRLRMRLPGMFSIAEDAFLLADVLSLSMCGLFFKAAARLKKGDRITVVFPLLGHCKELEVKATVLYVVHPDAANNFAQGFGVGFDDFPEEQRGNLQRYIRECFLKEVTASADGVGEFTETQLKR